jgi:hypothetical protein
VLRHYGSTKRFISTFWVWYRTGSETVPPAPRFHRKISDLGPITVLSAVQIMLCRLATTRGLFDRRKTAGRAFQGRELIGVRPSFVWCQASNFAIQSGDASTKRFIAWASFNASKV